MAAGQPIIRGIQAVGSVNIYYQYNTSDHILSITEAYIKGFKSSEINTSDGISIAGFRLDGEFLRANPQIASSFVIPILGGGGVAITNNNRTGTLSINCTKVSTPSIEDAGTTTYLQTLTDPETGEVIGQPKPITITNPGLAAMSSGSGIGPIASGAVYDLVTIAQVQQSQPGGDSTGATIAIVFSFNGVDTIVQFEGCTVATVDPLALTGNDAPQYNVTFNYLNWRVSYDYEGNKSMKFISD